MNTSTARGRGRPPSPVLSRLKIVKAALDIVDLCGHEALTMRQLAQHLNAVPSALYNHAASKRQVIDWVQDHIYASIDTSGFFEEPWDVALSRWADSYRKAFSEHPKLVPLISTLSVTGAPRTKSMYEDVSSGLLRGGWPEESIIDTIVAIESFVLGSVLDLAAPEEIFDPGDSAELTPVFAAAVASRRQGGAERSFLMGLRALISGLGENLPKD